MQKAIQFNKKFLILKIMQKAIQFNKKFLILLIVILAILVIYLVFITKKNQTPMLIETSKEFEINNGKFIIKINKRDGMVGSAKLKSEDFELNADLGEYNLFYPEVCVEKQDGSAEDCYISSESGKVTVNQVYADKNKIVIKAAWETGIIDSIWYYLVPKNKSYFVTRIKRIVKKPNVYSNFQQCTMVNPDMDDSYIVNYQGEWMKTMENHKSLFSTQCLEHSMFTALNLGKAIRYPAFGWYDRETNTSIGMITTYVSPNQRMTISYHGGGSTNQHPGYGEGQWNWFGKADGESIFLEEGTIYEAEIVYALGKGDPDRVVDEFNKNLFGGLCSKEEIAENVMSASWGGRRSKTQPDNPRYNWNFPEASSNYITSQQLFRYRGVSIPRSQNGTEDPQIFDLDVKVEINQGEILDLSPALPAIKPQEMKQVIENNSQEGIVKWIVNQIENSLSYKMFKDSDKLIVSGDIKISKDTSDTIQKIKNVYLEFLGSNRVEEVFAVSPDSYDFRVNDPILGRAGILLYNLKNIETVEKEKNTIKLSLPVKDLKDKNDIEYQFYLWPHEEWISQADQITPVLSLPVLKYRDYCRPLELKIYDKFYGR